MLPKCDLIGKSIRVVVDGRETLGVIGMLGKGKAPYPPDLLVVKYELNGEKDWTFLSEGVLRAMLERNEAVNA